MALRDFFKVKHKGAVKSNGVDRSVQIASSSKESFIDHLLNRGLYELAYYQLLSYYDTCGPLADAVDRRAETAESVVPVVKNTKTDEFIFEHPVLDLLAKPNPVDTYATFLNRLSAFYDVTGNAFLIDTGNVNKPPLELYVSSPTSVSLEQAIDGFVVKYMRNDIGITENYLRNDEDGTFRYYASEKASAQNKEIRHVKRFNTRGSLTNLRGASLLQSIYFDIEQFIATGKHNLSSLKRGARPSGILTMDSELGNMLSDDQRESLKEELRNFLSGEENAGRVAFLDAPLGWLELSKSNKDMDYAVLKKEVEAMIYKRYKIPMPFVSEETMTMANRESARMDFYEDAILPLLDRLFSELTQFLMYRYPDSEDLIITYDISKIPALEPRKLDQVKKQQDLGVFKTNELRALLGADSVAGGDAILVPMNLAPLDEIVASPPLEADQKATRDSYVALMQRQLNSEGTQRFTDVEIARLADEAGL